jgi:hypothetical protein
MMRLPQPDPYESHDPPALRIHAPTAVFLDGTPSLTDDRIADAALDWRPGMLVIAQH